MSINDPPDELQELTGSETGRWRVFTRDSLHIFDFDAGTVTRIPGPKAWPGANDRPRPIRSIESCRVGDRGYWTMQTDGWSPSIDHWWHFTSAIQKIVREQENLTTPSEADGLAMVVIPIQEEDQPPGQRSTAGLSDDGEEIPDLVAHLREKLGVQLVVDLGGATEDDDVEAWAKGMRIPRGDGMARLYLANQVVSHLEKRGVSAERIGRWFAAPNRGLSGMTPVELILEMDQGSAEEIVWAAARRFAILGR